MFILMSYIFVLCLYQNIKRRFKYFVKEKEKKNGGGKVGSYKIFENVYLGVKLDVIEISSMFGRWQIKS